MIFLNTVSLTKWEKQKVSIKLYQIGTESKSDLFQFIYEIRFFLASFTELKRLRESISLSLLVNNMVGLIQIWTSILIFLKLGFFLCFNHEHDVNAFFFFAEIKILFIIRLKTTPLATVCIVSCRLRLDDALFAASYVVFKIFRKYFLEFLFLYPRLIIYFWTLWLYYIVLEKKTPQFCPYLRTYGKTMLSIEKCFKQKFL